MRKRLTKFGKGVLSRETIDRMCRGEVEDADTVEDKYISMCIYPAKPRQMDIDGLPIPKRQVKKALAEIREELGYPDFRHKIWKGAQSWK